MLVFVSSEQTEQHTAVTCTVLSGALHLARPSLLMSLCMCTCVHAVPGDPGCCFKPEVSNCGLNSVSVYLIQ